MKVTKKEQQPEFKPVTLELTFETLREYQLFKQWIGNMSKGELIKIANQSNISEAIKNFDLYSDTDICGAIYDALNPK